MNLQQIPSHETSMRMMFKASTIYNNEHIDDNDEIVLNNYVDVMLKDQSWKKIKQVVIGDEIVGDDETIYKVVNIETINDKIKLKLA